MLQEYLNSWNTFRNACENKAKGRAVINSSGWKKLMEFHLDNYLKNLENPYMFLLTLKWQHIDIYNQHRMARFYYYYARKRAENLNPIIHGFDILRFPSWKK